MILFSPAKINIGLLVTRRREDGFHDLQSVMVPVPLYDLIEIMESDGSESGNHGNQTGSHGNQTGNHGNQTGSHGNHGNQTGINMTCTGIPPGIETNNNLCFRAYEMLDRETSLPPVKLHLHKQIPVGAGLGGGSSDASTTLKGLNRLAPDPVSPEKLEEIAGRLGSDCPFFLHGGTMMVEGKGDILTPVSLNLEGLFLVLLYPGIHIPTADAYREVKPVMPECHLLNLINEPVNQWRGLIGNDFEVPVFQKYPELAEIKQELYGSGALYASLSGSGSSLYGLFSSLPALPEDLARLVVRKGPVDCPEGPG